MEIDALMRSRIFRRALREAATITHDTGRETLFWFTPDKGKVKVGKVVTGGCGHVSPGDALKTYCSGSLPGLLHFHPSGWGSIMPSITDLKELLARHEKCREVMEVIGQVCFDKRVNLLFLQVTSSVGADSHLALAGMRPDLPEEYQEEIICALRKEGFRAELRSIPPRWLRG